MLLLAPLWLLAVAAVALPILYHLRRNTPPEVIRVGSVADLATGAATANRRVPRDLPLLLTRCALLCAVALALAGPVLPVSRPGRRVVVAPRGEWSTVDSLVGRNVAILDTRPSDYPWSVVVAADESLSPADTILLIAPDDASRWIGPRPTTRARTVIIPVAGSDAAQPGPPSAQLTPIIDQSPTRSSQASATKLLWWLAIALAPLERLLARRVPDAG